MILEIVGLSLGVVRVFLRLVLKHYFRLNMCVTIFRTDITKLAKLNLFYALALRRHQAMPNIINYFISLPSKIYEVLATKVECPAMNYDRMWC